MKGHLTTLKHATDLEETCSGAAVGSFSNYTLRAMKMDIEEKNRERRKKGMKEIIIKTTWRTR